MDGALPVDELVDFQESRDTHPCKWGGIGGRGVHHV